MPTGNLPAEGKKLFEEVYQKALKGSCNGDEACAAGSAWKAVHNAGWHKNKEGQWIKSSLAEFSMRIDRASYDKATGERRVRIVASDIDEDKRGDNMSLELFQDFIERIKHNEEPPAEYQSEYWKGGEPYISVSHYLDANGKTVPGTIDATYVDGSYLKSKGKFSDSPLGRRCFETICSELYGNDKDREDKIRVSIAFLDYMHKHKSNGFVYDRLNSDEPICKECLFEALKGKSEGKIFLKGLLIHEALTRVPANVRTTLEVDKSMAEEILTRKDDAKSIVGEELADELDKISDEELVGKSEALVIRSDEEPTSEIVEEAKPDKVPMEDEEQPDDEEAEKELHPKKKIGKSDVVEEADSSSEGGYLVIEPDGTKHLPTKKNGKLDHGLMGAAKAALTSPGGHRGNKYEGPNKASAIAKLKKLYASEKMEWNSEIEEGETMSKEDIIAIVKSAIAEAIEQPKAELVEVPVHPLDNSFAEFKSKFDEVMNSNLSEEDKLHQIQEPFNVLGTGIVTTVKSLAKPKVVTPEQAAQNDLINALSQVMNPIAQKLDMLLSQAPAPVADKPQREIPPRRSISPSLMAQSSLIKTEPTEENPTPKLRELISKTV